ncbi:BppU family phage baseplate upper protein [Enterococcus faecium]|uniref:BppU family phage baseplate upper protein n=1 Tax=Enterococcus faecium TaxID=1352 RepID=UPI001D13E967|nr:BppU family phage baseplate upper protein [Enterococcus faecium]
MASSLYNLALDFSKELNYTKAIMARQGDKGITVTVKPFLNGLQMDTSGGTFTLKGTTPSNRYVDSVATSVTSEEVTFSLDGTFMSEAGYYKHCYVEYRKDDQILTTQDIIFFSLGVSDISQGQADEYVSQLEELIRKYNETFDAFMAEIKVRVDSLNQQITDLTGQAKILQDKLDALKEEISKLGNLHVMYSNSIDFGGYDYSGRPNLFLNLDFSKLSKNGSAIQEPPAYVKDGGSHFILDFSDPSANGVDRNVFIPAIGRLEKGATYIATVPIMISDDFSTAYGASPIYPYCVSANNVETRVTSLYPDNSCRGKWGFIKKTFTVPANASDGEFTFFKVYSSDKQVGKLYIGYDIKIEKVTSTSDTATPYQPNLLDAPYYLSKKTLGKNLLDPTGITSSSYLLLTKTPSEKLLKDQTYTITLKGTKPSTQAFRCFVQYESNGSTANLFDMEPVEGLVDEWQLTFKATRSTTDITGRLHVYQVPNTSLGQCKVEWIKLEKGDTRTPNIEQYKYRGIGMRDSNNPKDYVWDLAPEYVEDNLATDVKISEITGKANNYTDGKVSEINSQLTASINEVDTTAKDAQTKANANATAIEDTKSRVDEIENNLYVLGEWKTLPLENGYTGADGTTPQYRVNLVNGHRNVVFNGAISTTAGTLPSQGQQHNASTLPTELIPSGTKMGLGATSLFTTSCRLAVTGKGTLYIGNDSGKDVKYCYLDLFSYWLD